MMLFSPIATFYQNLSFSGFLHHKSPNSSCTNPLMADFAFGLVQNILGTLATAAYDEITQAWGVEKDLEKVKQRLETIKQELLDAEQGQARDPEIRNWFMKLQHFCHDAENVLDEFEAESLRRRAGDSQTISSWVLSKFKTTIIFIDMNKEKCYAGVKILLLLGN